MEEILHHLAKTVKTLQGGPLPVISYKCIVITPDKKGEITPVIH